MPFIKPRDSRHCKDQSVSDCEHVDEYYSGFCSSTVILEILNGHIKSILAAKKTNKQAVDRLGVWSYSGFCFAAAVRSHHWSVHSTAEMLLGAVYTILSVCCRSFALSLFGIYLFGPATPPAFHRWSQPFHLQLLLQHYGATHLDDESPSQLDKFRHLISGSAAERLRHAV